MVEEFFIAPFALFVGFMGLLIGVLGLALTIYAFYDILFQQPEMETLEKLIWVIVILVLNLFGVLLYLFIVKYMDENPVADAVSASQEHRKVEDLERLADLRDRDILTEEEFQEEKERILGETGKNVPVNDETADE